MSSLKKGINAFLKHVSSYEINEKNIQTAIKEFKLLLIRNDVSVEVAEGIALELKEKMLGQRAKRFSDLSKLIIDVAEPILIKILTPNQSIDLLDEIKKYHDSKQYSKDKRPIVILFLGINGTGKTTTIAKLAHLLKKNNYRIILAGSDTFRSGAQEQLQIHADKIGIKLITGKYGSDSAAVAYDAIAHAKAKYADVVIIDTSGRMAVNKDLMQEMEKIHRISEPDFTILVVDALAGNDATEQARDFNKKIPINGIILAKMDADARGGALISVTYVTKGVPILYLGTGQKYDDLTLFEPEKYIKQLLKY